VINGLAIGVSATLAIFGGGALVKTAPLRGDIHDKWHTQIDLTFAALTEGAISTLRVLQVEADGLLGSVDDGAPGSTGTVFRPSDAIVDPAPLANLAARIQKLMLARKKLRARFARLLALCKFAPFVPVVYLVGVVLGAPYFIGWVHVRALGFTGVWISATAAVAATAGALWYAYLNYRLADANIMGREDGTASSNGRVDD
jgi:hypothetical protein